VEGKKREINKKLITELTIICARHASARNARAQLRASVRARAMHVMASRTQVQRVRILYKTILRLHRGLPAEIQPLGDNYVRDEFRRHKKCVESEAIIFLHEWTVSREAARP